MTRISFKFVISRVFTICAWKYLSLLPSDSYGFTMFAL